MLVDEYNFTIKIGPRQKKKKKQRNPEIFKQQKRLLGKNKMDRAL